MNQVQEMLRLESVDRLDEAIERLRGLFEVMSQQPGFLGAEVLRDMESPQVLIALHAWRDLADWQRFQATPWKVEFTAGRPQGLYQMVPCGMNWRSLQADGERTGGVLRREVLRGESPALRSGEGVVGCQTFVYQDDLPEYRGCCLRLTRLADPRYGVSAPEAEALADELYESLIQVHAPGAMVRP